MYPILMCFAAASGDLNSLKAMQSAFGGDPKFNCTDYDGRTPLHLASSEGQIECVEYLLLNGANVHALDKFNHTPLFDAVRCGHLEVVKLLYGAGAHFNDMELKEVTLRFHQ
jgi:lysophospholipase